MNQSPLLWSNILLTLDSVKTIELLAVLLVAPFCLLACMAELEISYNVEGKTLYLPELFLSSQSHFSHQSLPPHPVWQSLQPEVFLV